MSAEKSWSLLDHRPVLKYIPKCDDYIVYWNGIVMPHKMALCIGGILLNIFPTPEMRTQLQKNYLRLYYANAFDCSGSWDHIIHEGTEMYGFFNRYMGKHLEFIKEQNIPGSEVLGWFDYSRVAVVSD